MCCLTNTNCSAKLQPNKGQINWNRRLQIKKKKKSKQSQNVFVRTENTTEFLYLFVVHLDIYSLSLSALPPVAPTEENPF